MQIGKTSALTMNLTGIFKSILLVVAALMIWNTPITFLQSFGYAIALAGMFYYSMGKDAASNVEKAKMWVRDNVATSSGRAGLVRFIQDQLSGNSSYSRVAATDSGFQNQDLEAANKEMR
jgi:hypothetical protein